MRIVRTFFMCMSEIVLVNKKNNNYEKEKQVYPIIRVIRDY